jgi:hypothetical protein
MRLGIPAFAIVFAVATAAQGSARPTTSPLVAAAVVLVIGAPILYFSERSGVYVSAEGIESVPLSGRGVRISWTSISEFVVDRLDGRLAVHAALTTGERVALPSTQGWPFQRDIVHRICDGLNRELSHTREDNKTLPG